MENPQILWMNLDFTIPDLRIDSPANLFRHLALWAHVQLGCKECTVTDICPKFKKSKCCCEGATFVCHFWPRFWTLKRLLFFFASSIYFIDHRLCRCYGRREVMFRRLRSSSRRVSLRGMMLVVTWGGIDLSIFIAFVFWLLTTSSQQKDNHPENYLLLISINFTPQTSHSCLKEMVH